MYLEELQTKRRTFNGNILHQERAKPKDALDSIALLRIASSSPHLGFFQHTTEIEIRNVIVIIPVNYSRHSAPAKIGVLWRRTLATNQDAPRMASMISDLNLAQDDDI